MRGGAIAIALLTAGVAHAASPWQVAVRIAQSALTDGVPDLSPLDEARAALPAADRAPFERLTLLLFRIPRGERPGARAILDLVDLEADLLRRWWATADRDEQIELDVIAGEQALAGELERLGLPRPALVAGTILHARALVADHPDSGIAHRTLGLLLGAADDTRLEALFELGRCLQLAPASDKCRRGFGEIADAYQRPRCAGDDLRPIALYGAHQAAEGERSLFVGGDDYRLGRPIEAPVDEALLLPATGGLLVRVLLRFRPSSQRALEKATDRLSRDDGFLILFVAGAPRVALHPNEPLRRPVIEVELPLDTLCRRVTRRDLAADLKTFRR